MMNHKTIIAITAVISLLATYYIYGEEDSGSGTHCVSTTDEWLDHLEVISLSTGTEEAKNDVIKFKECAEKCAEKKMDYFMNVEKIPVLVVLHQDTRAAEYRVHVFGAKCNGDCAEKTGATVCP